MEALTLQERRRFTSSSSRRVEELFCMSGLPAQGLISGRVVPGPQTNWYASFERLGQERSRFVDLPPYIAAALEEAVYEQLTAAFRESGWCMATDQPISPTGWAFLARGVSNVGTVGPCNHAYVVRLKPVSPSGGIESLEDQNAEAPESILPDTDRTYSVQQMARAWERIGKPITEDDAELSVDPDDYPLF